ncbi:DUF6935 domain-containing protein [Spirochaetota bacterium]
MKKITIFFISLMLFFTGMGLHSDEKTASIKIEKIPSSIEEFVTLRNRVSVSPQGGATMMVIALYIYSINEKLGTKCLTVAIDRKFISKSNSGYKGYSPWTSELRKFKRRIQGKNSYKIRAYFPGTVTKNWYKLPGGPYVFKWVSNPYSSRKKGIYKYMLKTNGADFPRPMRVRKNNRGIWKAYEWSSFTLGVKKPKVVMNDDL